MKKFLKVCLVLFLCGVFFLLGWRVMPRVWPTIKTQVVYRVFPSLRPEPVLPEPYYPKGTAAFEDPIAPTDSLVYYFYLPYCSDCKETAAFVAGIPEQIVLADGTVSAVKFVPIASSSELRPTVLQAYADYGIAEDERQVPAIIIGDRCLMMPNDIYQHFYEALLSGEGLTTPLLNGNTRTE